MFQRRGVKEVGVFELMSTKLGRNVIGEGCIGLWVQSY